MNEKQGSHKKYEALEPIGLVCSYTRDRDPSYLGLTKMKMEHKSAHAVAVVAGQHPNWGGWVYPTGIKGPFKFQFNQQSKEVRQLRFDVHVIISCLEVLGHSNSCTTTLVTLKSLPLDL
ncbi:unnamed protein product [Sphenostylis stenocarpa]|uniref:Uncharacterized protein n=1 Tax=Sphenostylis stenocarpa TaxID=92480 RepID=A0AA86T5A5_9FABA|nr:unnamed protein product [Sphenostylis stenocarpa]